MSETITMTAESTAATGDNADQIEYWNGEAGDKWVRNRETQDRMLAPLGALSLAAADVGPGERVIDVGCGCGDSSLALARQVAPQGQVTGIDISEQMLAQARQRAAEEPTLPLSFISADAANHTFPKGETDVVHSRFGVMFFNNPHLAFANLAGALRPGGRLTFICWRPLVENQWVREPLAVAARLAELPPIPPPGTPGPFAFGDRDYLASILQAGAFTEVAIAPHDMPVVLGGSLEEGLNKIVDSSPVARALAGAEEVVRARVVAAIGEAMRDYMTPDGLMMGTATWLVTARKPG